jgi:ferredoxin-NADP reductase
MSTVKTRLTWQVGTVATVREETPTARTIALSVPGWPGHRAGQHVDVRLTAPDGYSAQRSYSIASPPAGPELGSPAAELPAAELPVPELTVQRLVDGEVSPYLTEVLAPGDQIELRGPIGGWFVWTPSDTRPVLLVAGGSGVVPLMAMIRTRAAAGSRVPFRLVYSVRDPDAALYAGELADRARSDAGLDVTYVYTRSPPPGWPEPAGRINADILTGGQAPQPGLSVFVCGPTGFVEAAADLLVDAGHEPQTIKTERFGPSGGRQ